MGKGVSLDPLPPTLPPVLQQALLLLPPLPLQQRQQGQGAGGAAEGRPLPRVLPHPVQGQCLQAARAAPLPPLGTKRAAQGGGATALHTAACRRCRCHCRRRWLASTAAGSCGGREGAPHQGGSAHRRRQGSCSGHGGRRGAEGPQVEAPYVAHPGGLPLELQAAVGATPLPLGQVRAGLAPTRAPRALKQQLAHCRAHLPRHISRWGSRSGRGSGGCQGREGLAAFVHPARAPAAASVPAHQVVPLARQQGAQGRPADFTGQLQGVAQGQVQRQHHRVPAPHLLPAQRTAEGHFPCSACSCCCCCCCCCCCEGGGGGGGTHAL